MKGNEGLACNIYITNTTFPRSLANDNLSTFVLFQRNSRFLIACFNYVGKRKTGQKCNPSGTLLITSLINTALYDEFELQLHFLTCSKKPTVFAKWMHFNVTHSWSLEAILILMGFVSVNYNFSIFTGFQNRMLLPFCPVVITDRCLIRHADLKMYGFL